MSGRRCARWTRAIRRRQLAELVELLDNRGNATILLGDFNSTWDDADSVVRELVDRTGLSAFEPESARLATHGDDAPGDTEHRQEAPRAVAGYRHPRLHQDLAKHG